MRANFRPWLGTFAAVGAAALPVAAGSHNGVRIGAMPAFALCIAVAFAIGWNVFVSA